MRVRINNDLLRCIAITDDDIDWVEAILHIKFDQRRRDIIKNMDTIDIQAFPGSGKTTVLVAKLAILAKKWPSPNCGICVLSHTNAARDEIERRLGNTEVGKKLLCFPHFIGTFHSFFDTFVAIPWLRSHGQEIKIIDSTIVKEIRWQRLSYSTLKYMECNHKTNSCCCAISLPIKVDIGKAGPTTDSYKDTVRVVLDSFKNGEYTFDEMLLLARKGLENVSCLPDLIVSRFPVLFVDEAQDTYADQWELLDMAFPSTKPHIRQCFGDRNQAIYQSYEGAEDNALFPRCTPLTLPDSKRFGQRIASLANCIALSKETMEGTSTAYSHLDDKHTVFLFDVKNPQAAITAYTSLVLSCFTDEELSDANSDGCCVIGMVHNQNDQNEEHIPRNINDYWENYDAKRAARTPSPKLLIEYFRIGKQTFNHTGEMNKLIDWIARGLRRYLNQYNGRSIPVAANALKSICNELSPSQVISLRKHLFFLASMSIRSEHDWSQVTDEIMQIAVNLFGLSAVKNSFLDWKDNVDCGTNAKRLNSCTLLDDKTKRELILHFGSIHSVKGRTHLSTLVVETFWNDPNIKSLLPWLCGCPPKKKCGIRNINRLKCHYVAFTRARALLCIAIPKNSITQQQIDALRKSGWNINDIT
jgi:DNA helicase-2/ATP-dependent DNA helicase PcrA